LEIGQQPFHVVELRLQLHLLVVHDSSLLHDLCKLSRDALLLRHGFLKSNKRIKIREHDILGMTNLLGFFQSLDTHRQVFVRLILQAAQPVLSRAQRALNLSELIL
jgi:hypothetical protein